MILRSSFIKWPIYDLGRAKIYSVKLFIRFRGRITNLTVSKNKKVLAVLINGDTSLSDIYTYIPEKLF